MQLCFSPPDRINDVWPLESGSSLTADELRLTIPVTMSMQSDGDAITLHDVPLLGVLEQLVEACDLLCAGEGAATMCDLYGEYEIELRRDRDTVVLLERYSGQRVLVECAVLCAATERAVRDAFDAVATAIPSVASNTAWVTMRAKLLATGGGAAVRS